MSDPYLFWLILFAKIFDSRAEVLYNNEAFVTELEFRFRRRIREKI
jgi:hypothetical protein